MWCCLWWVWIYYPTNLCGLCLFGGLARTQCVKHCKMMWLLYFFSVDEWSDSLISFECKTSSCCGLFGHTLRFIIPSAESITGIYILIHKQYCPLGKKMSCKSIALSSQPHININKSLSAKLIVKIENCIFINWYFRFPICALRTRAARKPLFGIYLFSAWCLLVGTLY